MPRKFFSLLKKFSNSFFSMKEEETDNDRQTNDSPKTEDALSEPRQGKHDT